MESVDPEQDKDWKSWTGVFERSFVKVNFDSMSGHSGFRQSRNRLKR